MSARIEAEGLWEDQFDGKVEKALKERLKIVDGVDVFVELKNNYSSSKFQGADISNVRELLNQKRDYFIPIREEILDNLTDDEFKINYLFSDGDSFSGVISSAGLTKLKDDPHISRIYRVGKGEFTYSTSLTLIQANEVRKIKPELTGRGLTVCVIDSGINYNHPDLGNCSPGSIG